MNKNIALINIETTGINKNKNHIFMVSIFTADKYYSFYAKNENMEEKIIKSSYKILKDKKIITYNGNAFDIKFLNNKVYQYEIYDFYKSYFDIYLFLKNYYKNPFKSLSLADISKNYLRISLMDKKELIKAYKFSQKNKTLSKKAIDENKKSLIARLRLMEYVKDEILTKNSKAYKIGGIDISLLIYNFKIVKNILVISSFYDKDIEIDMVKNQAQIKGENNRLEISLPLSEGKIGQDIYSCVKTDINNSYDFIDNLYPISKNNEFIEANIENLVSYILS